MVKRVAFQGIPGSFSSSAVRLLTEGDVELVGTNKFREIFEYVSTSRVDFGVVPVENAIAGSVHEIFDLMAEFSVEIVKEVYCPVRLSLLGIDYSGRSKEEVLANLTHAISHPKALEQCSHFFQKYPHILQVIHSDTAGAAREVSNKKSPALAAIASEEAASLYGLHTIFENVQNHEDNTTRFFLIRKPVKGPKTGNKASFVLTLKHEPGSLVTALNVFALSGANLTKIESRPIPGRPYHYRFFIDAKGDPATLQAAARECLEVSTSLVELGYYTDSLPQ